MTWNELLNNGDVQLHTTSKTEIEALRKLIERDLRDSQIEQISGDRRFATAYNAALQLAQMAMAVAGYRIRKGQNVHLKSFETMPTAIPTREIEDLCDYFDRCRRKRHDIDYDISDVATEKEVREIIQKTMEFRTLVEAWIDEQRPELKT